MGWVDVEWCWTARLGPEPAIVTEDPSVAAAKRVTVAAFIRRGVSHLACCACSQDRAPVAPAMAAIAHTAHMRSKVLLQRSLPAISTRIRRMASAAGVPRGLADVATRTRRVGLSGESAR